MHPGKSQSEHIDEFRKLVGNLAAIDTAISVEDQALLLLTSLPSSYDNFVKTLLYGRDTLKLEDSEEHLKKDCPRYNHKKSQGFVRIEDQESGYGADGYDSVDVMAMSVEEILDWIMDSGGSYHITYMRDYLVDFEEYDGGKILLGDGRECVYRGQRSTQQCTKSGVTKHLGVVVIQQQNGLVKEMNVTLMLRSPSSAIGFKTPIDMLGFFGWLASIKQGMLEPVKVKCIFLDSESGEYNKTFIDSGVGTGFSTCVTRRIEFRWNHLGSDHTFEVDLMECRFIYREDSNEAAFAVAEAEKIYAHESLTFNNTVACEVISKWKAGLKDDMDARSDVYVLSNGCKKCSDDSDVYYWAEIWATKGLLDKAKGNVLGMEIVRDQSGNTLRVSQSRFYNWKLVQTLLEGHSILSLEGSLSRDVMWKRMLGIYTYGGCKGAIWLKGLAIESGFELKIVAGIATGALSKAIPGRKVPA
ncbi:hypothetical protein Tco_0769478 [Tanacetum coccineum]|uniref:Retrovirus-related Pol polyprotein from transposon TNT 1-94-like beta-barrel domain-containing protein n=1 Tax=Tanacetum coccineum TaxID=301880 RepID=A0ABQ4ZCE5_9ASTR